MSTCSAALCYEKSCDGLFFDGAASDNRLVKKNNLFVCIKGEHNDGHNFAKTMLKLSETNDTIGVVMDQVGTPTSATELAKAIKYLVDTDNYGLFHGTCEGDTNWAEFAQTVLRLAGKKTVIEPITSQEYKRRFPASADRPAYSILENYMLKLTTDFSFAPWQDAIEVYMKELLG